MTTEQNFDWRQRRVIEDRGQPDAGQRDTGQLDSSLLAALTLPAMAVTVREFEPDGAATSSNLPSAVIDCLADGSVSSPPGEMLGGVLGL